MTAHENSKVVDKNGVKEKATHLQSPHGRPLTKEDLAPDGGWGWMVVGGMIVVNLVTICQGSTFGLIYSDFLDSTGSGGSALTVLNLMIMISLSVSGPISNKLLKTYSIKPVGIIGAVIYAIANTLVCFAPNIFWLTVSFFGQGVGIGITMTVCNISFNSYFVKLRTRVMGATQVAVGLGSIIYPPLAEYLLRIYGFRGCSALLGAISFHGVVSMYMMDPVERHYKKPTIIMVKSNETEDEEMSTENLHHDLQMRGKKTELSRRHSMDVAKGCEKNRSVLSLRAEAEHEKPLLIEALKTSHKSQDRNGSGIDIETGFPRLRTGKGSHLDLLVNKFPITAATSTTSINGIAGFSRIPDIEVTDEDEEKKKSILSIMGDFFEVSLLRDGIYLNITIGSSLTFMSDILFMGFLPMIMTSQGYTKPDIALAITVSAIIELAGKILFMIFAIFFTVKARYVFLTSVYCLIICRIAFLYSSSLTSLLIVIGISGAVRSWFLVNQMLVLAEHFNIERFTAAWTLFTVINGCISVIVCPLLGFVKDFTQSYVITQYMLLGGLVMCAISWTVEIFIYDVFARRKTAEMTINNK